jgi:hypothetical protein
MKTLTKTATFVFFMLHFISISLAQELSKAKEIKTSIEKVTVFVNGAEIVSTAQVNLAKGKNELVFVGISPSIMPETIQLEGDDLTILAISQQMDYLTEQEKDAEIEKLMTQKKSLEEKIKNERMYVRILEREMEILLSNKSIGGENGFKTEDLKLAMDYYRQKLTEIEQSKASREQSMLELNENLGKIQSQLSEIQSNNRKQTAKILATVQSEKITSEKLTIKYLVSDAGWLPTYDVRVESIEKPILVSYKANIYQSTGVDWKGVNLTVSSGNPNLSNISPQLNPWYLDFWSGYSNNTNYNNSSNYKFKGTSYLVDNIVQGQVFSSEDYSPLPGVTVMVKGTAIGTSTDLDGRFRIQLPQNYKTLVFSFVGYQNIEVNAENSIIDVTLTPDMRQLEEVVVSALGIAGSGSRVNTRKEKSKNLVSVTQITSQTNFAYQINVPYDIPANGKATAVEMIAHEVPAKYVYSTAPKLLENAFLVAQITDWGKYNFLQGEANLYLEDKYIGRSMLNTQMAVDTLNISLGRDESIMVKRTRMRDFEEKKFFGTKRKEQRVWEISLKNTKKEKVTLQIQDQIPVSSNEAIQIDVQDLGGATYDKEKGILTWNITLQPNESKKLTFKYTVEYPKNKMVEIE